MLRPCLLLLVGSALAGCVADTGDEGFVIVNNSASDNCSFTGALDQPFIPAGNLSLFSPTGYFFTPLMQSRIVANAGQDVQRTIYLRGARVDLKVEGANISDGTGAIRQITPTLPSELTHFKQLVSGSITPGGSANVGFEIVPWAVLPALKTQFPLQAGERLHVILTATVTMFGDLGGGEVDALPFVYPVQICNDCNATVAGVCTMNMPPAVQVLGNACNPFQDGTITCCTGDMGQLICPIQ